MKSMILPSGIVLIVAGALLALFNTAHTAYPTYLLIAGVVVVAFYTLTNLREMAKRSTMYGLNALLMSGFLVAILVVVYLIAQNRDKTWDFSATGKYTLDPQTAKILDSLEMPVSLLLFYPTFERQSREFEQVKTLMEEYKKRTDKISYTLIDASKDYDTAMKYKAELSSPLQPAIVAEVEVDGKPVREKAKGQKQEDISNAIKKVTHRQAMNAYFMVGHYEKELEGEGAPGLAILKTSLGNENIQANPLRLGASADIPKDANIIAIVGPEEDLTEVEIGALRRFLLGGGSLFVAIDPKTCPSLVDLLKGFGIEVGSNMAIQMVVGAATIEDALVGRYSAKPSDKVEVEKFDEHHEITKDLSRATVQFYKARSVGKLSSVEGVTVTTLAETAGGKLQGTSLPNSWADSEPDALESAKTTIENLYDAKRDKEGPVTLAAAAEINLDKIPDGKPDPGNPQKKGKIVVVGDSDFLANGSMGGRGSRGHHDFALNIFNWLSGQVDLITIRQPEMDNTSIVLSSDQKSLIRNLCVVVIPIFLIPAIGLGVGFYRRMKYV
jgi:ABC-type uncharacterized transport system involved in gliding motility auxiliary subunit